MARSPIRSKALDISQHPKGPSRLPLGKNEGPVAVANRKQILEIARLVQSMGDFEIDEQKQQEIKKTKDNVKLTKHQRLTNCWNKVVKTVCLVVDWLEQPSHQKHATDQTDSIDSTMRDTASSTPDTTNKSEDEMVLRGLYHIIVLGSQTLTIKLLEVISDNLDIPGNLYSAKREYAEECLRLVEEKYYPTLDVIEKASDLLVELTRDFEPHKVDIFNSYVGRAQLEIQLCRDFLDEAKTAIDELMEKVSIVKYVSRGVRLLGWGVTCYSLYRITSSTSKLEDLANYVVPLRSAAVKKLILRLPLLAGYAISGYLWLSSFRPKRAYELRENLEKMQYKHSFFMMQLKYLDRRLELLQNDFSRRDSV
ncbi:uncharacterized protein LOC124434366 [Xenia sp. Carnegie-2017]|uniref:uncharacterized protein LOC124434366 n=1 Tax=Xenia sp. Carnegie-2017 TaxID=2897299 RepID=UPI001F03A684|nr:uncharacterized protein LOC124434366 [Xenia sp. Carnegie-2017]